MAVNVMNPSNLLNYGLISPKKVEGILECIVLKYRKYLVCVNYFWIASLFNLLVDLDLICVYVSYCLQACFSRQVKKSISFSV